MATDDFADWFRVGGHSLSFYATDAEIAEWLQESLPEQFAPGQPAVVANLAARHVAARAGRFQRGCRRSPPSIWPDQTAAWTPVSHPPGSRPEPGSCGARHNRCPDSGAGRCPIARPCRRWRQRPRGSCRSDRSWRHPVLVGWGPRRRISPRSLSPPAPSGERHWRGWRPSLASPPLCCRRSARWRCHRSVRAFPGLPASGGRKNRRRPEHNWRHSRE